MFGGIFQIAILCIVIGCASIPASFLINASPFVVWAGNALGSLLSAVVVILIGDHLFDQRFRQRINKTHFGRKIVHTYDQGDKNKNVLKARTFINKHGLKLFSLLCPVFPGVLISTVTVYVLDLDKKTYKWWMFAGVIFVSGAYVFSYWWAFVR